ncbi:hypothetical protein ACFL0H_00270 [Thermodesulfobacteriota bacterium]
MTMQEVITVFKEAGFSGRIYGSMEDALKAKVETCKPVNCNYRGISRDVHPEACKWHRELNDPECLKCKLKK